MVLEGILFLYHVAQMLDHLYLRVVAAKRYNAEERASFNPFRFCEARRYLQPHIVLLINACFL